MTAAFVLLCSVYCACGGVVSAGLGPVAGQPERQAAAGCTAHCHDHGGTPGPSEHDGAPDRGQSGHAGCGHCNPVLSVIEPTSDPVAVHAPAWAAPALLVPGSPVQAQLIRLALAANQDLPPPTSAPTLLSLHCALNT